MKKSLMKALSITLLATVLISYAFPTTATACTLFGATGKTTTEGNAILGSTSDNPYLPGPRKPVYVTIPKDGGFKFVHTPCLIKEDSGQYTDVGSDRGMNEKGFSWTRSWVVPTEPENQNKMNAVDWFLKLGSTVSTVDEAIEFVKNNPKGIGTQGNYIFADAKGNLAVVEVSYETVTVVEKYKKDDQGMVARANRWESSAMKPLDDSAKGNPVYFNTSEYRYYHAMELLKASSEELNVELMKKILSDRNASANKTTPHAEEISNHGATDGTVSAEIYDPANLTFWYTYGWPDGDIKDITAAAGENKNSWGTWIPFVLTELEEEGFYTDWQGNITPMGARYLSKMVENQDTQNQEMQDPAADSKEPNSETKSTSLVNPLTIVLMIGVVVLAFALVRKKK